MARLTPDRVAAGFAWGGLAGAVSYPLQRLYAWWSGEIPYAVIVAQEHVPYFWRVGLTGFHAVLVGVLVVMLARDEQAAASLKGIPAAVGVVLVLALLMVLVP